MKNHSFILCILAYCFVVTLLLCCGTSNAFVQQGIINAKLLTNRNSCKVYLSEEKKDKESNPSSQMRRAFLASTLLAGVQYAVASSYAPSGFDRIPTQFIAALGDPESNSGVGAENWGIWEKDPGPRGVWLSDYDNFLKSEGIAPAGWKFDSNDWWLEEHGLIMEAPQFPLRPGRYLVTGGRLVTTVLTVEPPDTSGLMRWSLEDKNSKLYDVTHLPCRSARYTPNAGMGSPTNANKSDFPVAPGASMPEVQGCNKQDYAVLFVIGLEKNRREDL